MNIDLIILFLLLNNNNYKKYISTIDFNYYKLNSRDIYKLLVCIKELQEKYDQDSTVNDLMLFFFQRYPALKQEEHALYEMLFSKLASIDVDNDVAEEYFVAQMNRMRAAKAAEVALAVVDGRADFDELIEAVGQEKPKAFDDDDFVTDDLQVLYENTRHQKGLEWPLKSMNKSLGSLRPGDFGFIMARPETGKTTFVSHVAVHMTQQHNGNTLWINNEEQGTKVKVRNFQSLLGQTVEELFSGISEANAKWQNCIGNRLRLYDDAGISVKRVEALAAELNPKLIIIDQLDKIKGAFGESGHTQLKNLYQWARELAKKYNCPVIGVSQASVSGEDKFYLTMEDIDGSKTGKPGEADFIIGIGKTESAGEYARGISICKNKLTGDEDSNPALRHMKCQVAIVPDIARYEDVESF